MKPGRPVRVKVSNFDMRTALGTRTSIGQRLNPAKVGRGGPKFRIFDGFHEISDLIIVMGLTISGIIINTQLMVLNAWTTSKEVNL